MFYFKIFLLFITIDIYAITYTPNDDINTSEREFTPTLDCYYQKKENISEYGYTLQCYDVADTPTSKHYIVTKDLNNTALTTDLNSNNLLQESSENHFYINKTDSEIYTKFNYYYDFYSDYLNNSDNFDQQFVGSYSTDIGTMYFSKSGTYDKSIALSNAYNMAVNQVNAFQLNDIKSLTKYNNNINSAILSNSENLLKSSENIKRSIDDTNVRLDSIAGNTLGTAYNARDTAYNTYSISQSASSFLDLFDGLFDMVDVPPLDGLPENNDTTLTDFTNEQNANSDSVLASFDTFKADLDSIYSDIENVKTTFNDSLVTIDNLKNNNLSVRSGQLVDTNVNVFGKTVHFDMYSSFSAFKPIGTWLFTFIFLYLILFSSIRILIGGH